jgi:hypothetical protein
VCGGRSGAVGLVALDGTKLQADASSLQNYDQERLGKAIGHLDKQIEAMLAEAAGQDAAEDVADQDRSDPGSPPELRSRQQRLAKLKAAKELLVAQAAAAQQRQDQRREAWEKASGPKGGSTGGDPTEAGVVQWANESDRSGQSHHAHQHRVRAGVQRPGRGDQ